MLKVSSNIDALTCGDARITRLLMGDLQPGSLVLLDGESGTGKSVFCQQLAYNALYNNTGSVAYFTTSHPDALLDGMESFSFHVHYHYLSDKLRVYSLKPVNDNLNFDEAAQLLLECLNSLPPAFTLAVVDSISQLLANVDTETQIMLLRDIKSICRRHQRSVIMVTSPFVFAKHTLPRVAAMCDYYVKTAIITMPFALEQMDSRATRALEVRKMCGVEMAPGNLVRFEVREGSGIHILPYVTVRA